ncbi:MAG: HYR domain-containing protein [Sphingobacteriales bacterium]|nr:HYR domain-containing protein [Sphingobacteriales bacterium]
MPTLTATTSSNDYQTLVTVIPPITTDNCGATQVAGNETMGKPSTCLYPVGTTTISWVAMDMNGNSNTCTQDVIVSDQTAPHIFSDLPPSNP